MLCVWLFVVVSSVSAINFHNARQVDLVNSSEVLRNTGVSIRYQPLFDDIVLSERYLTLHAREVDLVSVDVVWKSALDLLPLDQYDLSNVHDRLLYAVNGATVALPWDPNLGVLVYNKQLFTQYGFQIPSNWDEIEALIQHVVQTDPEVDGFIFSGAAEAFNCFMLELIKSHNGGEFVNLTNKEVTIYNEGAIKAITMLNKWFANDWVPWSVFALADEDVVAYFNTIGVNVLFARVWINEVCTGDKIDLNKWGVMRMPGGFATLGGFGIGIHRNTSHLNESVAVLRYLDQIVKHRPSCLESKNISLDNLDLVPVDRFYGTLEGGLFSSCARLIQTSLQSIFTDKFANISESLLMLKCDLVHQLNYSIPSECVSRLVVSVDRNLKLDDFLEGVYWAFGGLTVVALSAFVISKLPQFGNCFVHKYTLVVVATAVELIDLAMDSVNSWDVATNTSLREFHVPFIAVYLVSTVVSIYRIYSYLHRLHSLCKSSRDAWQIDLTEGMFRKRDAMNTVLSMVVEDIPFIVLNFMTQLDSNSGFKQTLALVWNSFSIGLKAMHVRLFFQLSQQEQNSDDGYSLV